MISTKERILALRSAPENIQKIEPFLAECRCDNCIDEELYFDILLVLTEAVNNSILHGNQANPEKWVTVRFKSLNNALHFTVKDEGRGFDPNGVPDPTQKDRVDQPCGRGLYLMRSLAHEIDFKDDGRTVKIGFRY